MILRLRSSVWMALNLSRARTYGLSLLEVIIVLGLFGIVLSVVGDIAINSFRNSSHSLERDHRSRQISLVLNRIAGELRQCESIAYPIVDSWEEGKIFTYSKGQNAIFAGLFNSRNNAEKHLVAYRYLGSKGVLERCVFSKDHVFEGNLESSAGIISKKILLDGVTKVSFGSLDVSKSYGKKMVNFSLDVVPHTKNIDNLSSERSAISLNIEVQVRGL